MIWFSLPRKESGVLVTLTLVVIASILTAFGIFDVCVSKLKSALIILGIGANIFKLAGSVILYGIVSVYIFGLIRLFVLGG